MLNRTLVRAAAVARAAGVALLFVAAVLSIYITASVGKPWRDFQPMLQNPGFITRLRFDATYYRALSRATDRSQSDAQRAERARQDFAVFEGDALSREAAERAQAIEDHWRWFENDFDAEAFLAAHAQSDSGEEDRMTAETMEYLDSLTQAKAKGKAAKLKPASQAPYFQEAYDALAAEKGDAAGTYAEYLSSLRRMIEADIAGGQSVRSARDWHAARFDWDRYAEALSEVRVEGHAASQSLTDQLSDRLKAGESPAAALRALYAENPGSDELSFLTALRRLLPDPTFDGAQETLVKAMEQGVAACRAGSVDAFMENWGRRVVAEADDRAIVGIVSPFWYLVSHFMTLWLAGAALVLFALIADRVAARRALRAVSAGQVQEDPDALLRVEHLCQYFRDGDHVSKAVNDVSFTIKKGEVLGLVGESGCGKTTTGRAIIGLYPPTSGGVYLHGLRVSSTREGLPVYRHALKRDARKAAEVLRDELNRNLRRHPENSVELRREYQEKLRTLRADLSRDLDRAEDQALTSEAEQHKAQDTWRQRHGRGDRLITRMQMIFQDPIASIDPRMTVREIIAEGLCIRGVTDREAIDRRVNELLDLVGLVPEHADRYPHEFSGGQRQRIGIARAIALEPELIIADEPISALDVSIQAQVINLLNDLRNRMGLTIMFIAHNLSVVKYFSDRIAVMYFGHIVEMATSDELFAHPLHPYTKSLLSAIPYPDPHYEKQPKRIEYNPAKAHDYSKEEPTLREIVPGHLILCNEAEYQQYLKEIG